MNIYDLISRAQKLRKETQLDSVSPDRVGGLHEDTLKYINEFQLLASSPSLHKIYASVSAMQSDKSPKSDLTGKPLKPGQLVVIVPANQADATAGDVYRYDGPSGNTSAWTFVAKIGAVPADAELSATSTNPPQNKVVTEKLTELESKVVNIIANGDGDNFVRRNLHLIAGHKYRLNVINPNWAYKNSSSNNKLIVTYYVDGTSVQPIKTSTVNSIYEIDAVECDNNNEYVIAVRADKGESAIFWIEDITDTSLLESKTVMAIFSNNLVKVSDNEVQLLSVTIRDIDGVSRSINVGGIDGTPRSYVFSSANGTYLVLTSNDSIVLKQPSDIVPTDLVLLFYYANGNKFNGGALFPHLIDIKTKELESDIANLESNVKKTIFSNNLVKVSDNSVKFYSLVVINADGTARTIPNTMGGENPIVFGSDTGQYLVLTSSYTMEMRATGADVLPTDIVLLFHYTNGNKFNGGALFPHLIDIKTKELESDIANLEANTTYDAEVCRDVHIALMNKYAERFGAEKSLFMQPNGNSYICARDMAMVGLACIANDKLSSVWGEAVGYAPVFGDNQRLDKYESTYLDAESHPLSAEITDYYKVWGGKTGSNTSIDPATMGRNLVLCAKSNVDDTWLLGVVLYAYDDVLGDNRFQIMKSLFDALESKRKGEAVDISALRCRSAYAVVVPNNGNISNYALYADRLESIGKDEYTITNSHSVVKLLTALVALDNLNINQLLTFTSADPYGGVSGAMYSDSDKLYMIDAVRSMIITSSSVAARCLARYVGNKILQENSGLALYSFGLLGKIAYGVGTQSWLDWLATSDYLVWSAKTGKTLTCADESSPVLLNGETAMGFVGGDIISHNNRYVA